MGRRNSALPPESRCKKALCTDDRQAGESLGASLRTRTGDNGPRLSRSSSMSPARWFVYCRIDGVKSHRSSPQFELLQSENLAVRFGSVPAHLVEMRNVCKQPKVDCFKAYYVGYLHAAITNSQCFKYQACQIELHESARPYSTNVRCRWEYPGARGVVQRMPQAANSLFLLTAIPE